MSRITIEPYSLAARENKPISRCRTKLGCSTMPRVVGRIQIPRSGRPRVLCRGWPTIRGWIVSSSLEEPILALFLNERPTPGSLTPRTTHGPTLQGPSHLPLGKVPRWPTILVPPKKFFTEVSQRPVHRSPTARGPPVVQRPRG